MNNPYYQWSGLLRTYVHDKALCRSSADFDAKSRKIRRVGQPEVDSDVASKRYVDDGVKKLKNQQDEVEKKLIAFEKDVQALWNVMSELQYKLTQITADAAHLAEIRESI